jgi:hypothetical protein
LFSKLPVLFLNKSTLSPLPINYRRRKDEMQHNYFLNRRSGEYEYQTGVSGGGDGDRSAGYQQETLDPRLEIRSDIVVHHRRQARRRDYFVNNNVDWRSDIGGGRRSKSNETGRRHLGGGGGSHDIELTDFGLIDLPAAKPRLLSPANQLWRNVNARTNGGSKSQLTTAATTVRKGLLWVQKDRFFAR